MTDDKVIEAAAKAAYIKTKEFAPKRYSDPDVLSRYVPWDDLPDSWRDDFTATISAAIAAADTVRAEGFDCEEQDTQRAQELMRQIATTGGGTWSERDLVTWITLARAASFAAGLAKGEAERAALVKTLDRVIAGVRDDRSA